MPKLCDVAAKHELSEWTIELRLRQNPSLKRRRDTHQQGMEQRRNRRALESAFASNPDMKISNFSATNKKEYRWLMLYDREWLVHHLAACGKGRAATRVRIERGGASGEDDHAESLLRSSVQAWLNGPVPFRITKRRLLQLLPVKSEWKLSSGAYPKTNRALNDLAETATQYQLRIGRRLASLAAGGDAETAKSLASAVIAQFSHRSDIVARFMDPLLTQTKTAAKQASHSALEGHEAGEEAIQI